MSDLEFENLNQGGDISCGSGMYKECIGTTCKCVEGSKTDYVPWILAGFGILLIGGLGVSAYRAYKGMPEPGVVWAQGREPARDEYSMTRSKAVKLDKGEKYIDYDHDSGLWAIIGANSGFAYGTFASKIDAENYLEESSGHSAREPARSKSKDYYHFYVEYPDYSHHNRFIDKTIESVVGRESAGTGIVAGVRDLSFYFDTLKEAKTAYKRLENSRELKELIRLDHKIRVSSWNNQKYNRVREIAV